jgi:hypothetical protein
MKLQQLFETEELTSEEHQLILKAFNMAAAAVNAEAKKNKDPQLDSMLQDDSIAYEGLVDTAATDPQGAVKSWLRLDTGARDALEAHVMPCDKTRAAFKKLGVHFRSN